MSTTIPIIPKTCGFFAPLRNNSRATAVAAASPRIEEIPYAEAPDADPDADAALLPELPEAPELLADP